MTDTIFCRHGLKTSLLAMIALAGGCSGNGDADALNAPAKSVAVREGSISDAMPTLEINAVDGTAIDHSVPPEPKPLITPDGARASGRSGPQAETPKAKATGDAADREDAPKPAPAPEPAREPEAADEQSDSPD